MTGRSSVLSSNAPGDGGAAGRGWLAWLKGGAALLLIGGFGAAVAYVYYQMTRDGGLTEGAVPVVRADTQPFRVRPANPGGMDVPHQNLEVFNRLSQPVQTQARGAAPAERLLPPPEAPVQRPVAAPQRPAPAANQPQANAARQAPPQAAVPPQGPPGQRPNANTQVAAAPPAAGATRVQLAALPTEERANQELERIRRTGREVLGGMALRVVRGEGANGTPVYRVVGGPMRDRAAAASLCERLRERRVSCVIAR